MPAKSPGVPQRPAGVRAVTRSSRPGISARPRLVSAVSIQPGRTALTWMLSLAQGRWRAPWSAGRYPLAGGVGRVEGGAEDRHHRADVDDLAAAGTAHRRVGRLAAEEGAGQGGVEAQPA